LANIITDECVNCGACESVCPAGGISSDGNQFVIDAARCTECVGFYHTQQCARVCPVDCSIVDPDNIETEAELFERAKKLNSERAPALVLSPDTSHFQAHNRTFGGALRRRVGRWIHGARDDSEASE
jgi:NAD-dependent dihydropyrimidine dehydrogenase PreA subunit